MKVLIFTSHIEKFDNIKINKDNYDAFICADKGHLFASQLNIRADYYIGDYDSSPKPDYTDCIVLPCEKDVTDSEAAIDLAIEKGFDYITVLGGLGGRFDHTMGNVGLLSKYLKQAEHIAFVDGNNYVFMLLPGKYEIPKNCYKYMGLISYGDTVESLTLQGTKYTLDNYNLNNHTTLGVSNEIISEKAIISFTSGKLLVILSNDT